MERRPGVRRPRPRVAVLEIAVRFILHPVIKPIRGVGGMGDPPITRPSLLLRVRDPRDNDAWREFVELYGPLVYRFSRKRGLQDADAADLTQIVFQAITAEVRRLKY